MRTFAPDTFEDAAAALAAAAAAGDAVQIRGAGTKLAWGTAQPQAQTELCTTSLDRVLEHNVGDLTAVVQAGVPFARLRAQLAGEGQMLAIDPALGNPDEEATIGGVIARSRGRALVKLASRPSRLADLLPAVDAAGGTLVGRAALGTSYVEVDPDAVARLREALRPGEYSTLLDAPADARAGLDAWGPNDPVALGLMQRVKRRFDPAQACNPGAFVGGI